MKGELNVAQLKKEQVLNSKNLGRKFKGTRQYSSIQKGEATSGKGLIKSGNSVLNILPFYAYPNSHLLVCELIPLPIVV